MTDSNKVLALIPARGGSKGIPRKNIKEISGKPLIAWTIEEAKKSRYIDRVIVSTEDEEIASISKAFGAEVPFLRPKELSEDTTPGIEPILHAVEALPGYDYIMLLQPTSPLRTVEDIDSIISLMLKKDYKSIVSVCLSDKTPSWMFRMSQEDNLESYLEEEVVSRRQEGEELYILNGAMYLIDLKELRINKSFFTSKTKGFVMPKERSFDIDDMVDFKICEKFLDLKNREK